MLLLNLVVLLFFISVIYCIVKVVQEHGPAFMMQYKAKKEHPPKNEKVSYAAVGENFDNRVGELVQQQEQGAENQKSRLKNWGALLGGTFCRNCDIKGQYQELIKELKIDLMQSERRCRHLQQQLEWMSNKTMQLEGKVIEGQEIYATAVGELAQSLQYVQQVKKKSDKSNHKSDPACCSATKADVPTAFCPLMSRFKAM